MSQLPHINLIMNGSLYLCKNDVKLFFRRNVLKFIPAFAIAVLAIILAIRNAVCIDEINDFFEDSGRITLGYVRGDRSLLIFTFITFCCVFFSVACVPICAYNDLTLVFSGVSVAVISYRDLFDAVIILRYYSIKALPFFVFHAVVTAAFVMLLICYAAYVENLQFRYRYGVKELVNLICASVPFFIAFSCLYVIRITFVCIGCLFL